MKKMLLFLLPTLLALTATALASGHTDSLGNVWESDGAECFDSATAPLAEQDGEDGLTPLGDPSNLRWDTEEPGTALWETTGAFQRKLKTVYYHVDRPDEPVLEMWHDFGGVATIRSFSDFTFLYSSGEGSKPEGQLASGDYYFTVQNLGDGVTYSDSAVVSSRDLPGGIYHYVEPGKETTLETPEVGHWEWPAAFWDDRQDEDERIRTYYIEFGYSAERLTDTDGIRFIGGTYSSRSGTEDRWLQDRLIGENGAGWYYFRIRPISANIETWRNGSWSEWSEGYNLLEASKRVTEALNAIDKEKPAETIRKEVQQLNRTELKNALTADIQGAGTGTEAALSALEEALGGPAEAVVAEELKDRFDAGGVSVVGAALNNVTGDGEPSLNIGSPKQDNHVRDENFNNTLAVDFSMDLDQVEDTHALAVPVKVTLPIPADINPEFLAILHYRADGSFEEVTHTVYKAQETEKWFVSFVLTSFSDFTLTERMPSIEIKQDGHYQLLNASEEARLYLGRYEGGRLRSLEELESRSGILEGSGKLFLLDGGYRPLCPAGSFNPAAA